MADVTATTQQDGHGYYVAALRVARDGQAAVRPLAGHAGRTFRTQASAQREASKWLAEEVKRHGSLWPRACTRLANDMLGDA